MKIIKLKIMVVLASLLLFSASCNDPYSNLGNGSGGNGSGGNGNGNDNGSDGGGGIFNPGGGWNPSDPGFSKKILKYRNISKALGFYDFDGNDNVRQIRNDLSGSLTGMVQFGQSHTINPKGNTANFLPSLVSERSALLLFTPTEDIAASVRSLMVEVTINGEFKGYRSMSEPDLIPQSDSTQSNKTEVLYSRKAWSVELPWNWVVPGMELQFIEGGGKQGLLPQADIEFGPPSEAVFTFLRLGMLTEYRTWGNGYMMDSPARAMADYFQTIPVAKAINVTYENRSLDRVIVYDGTIYDVNSPDPNLRHSKDVVEANDPYAGDMRAAVAKSQVSIGINMANYGIPSNNMGGGYSHYFYIMTTHLAQGLYANNVVVAHGLSGGNGIGTLMDTTGNEFSHEVGHSYGFGHFQQPSGKPAWWQGGHADSGWGYSAYKKRMRANLWWGSNGSQGNTPDNHFKRMYNYGRDTMSGGWNESAISQYTHLTGYSAMRGQDFFAEKPIVSEASSTGYLKWNKNTKKMEEFTQSGQNGFKPLKPYKVGVPVITILGGYYPRFENDRRAVMMPYFRANWGNVFKHEEPNLNGDACWLEIDFANGEKDRIKIANTLYDGNMRNPSPNQFHVNIEEARAPVSAKLFCKNNVVTTPTELASQTIPTNLAPMKPPVIIGKEYGYEQAIAEEIGIFNTTLEKYKDEETPVLKLGDAEILVWLYDNISQMSETAQAVAERYIDSFRQSKTIEKFIDDNYQALKAGDANARVSLEQIYSKSGFGDITAPFSLGGQLAVQGQCLTLVGQSENSLSVKISRCVAGDKNQSWFMDSLYRVRNSQYPHKCMEASTSNYVPVTIKTCENIPAQGWTVTKNANDHRYLMRHNANTGRCLNYDSNTNHAVTWGCSGNDAQLWTMPPKDTRKSIVFLSNENYDIIYDLFKK